MNKTIFIVVKVHTASVIVDDNSLLHLMEYCFLHPAANVRIILLCTIALHYLPWTLLDAHASIIMDVRQMNNIETNFTNLK